MGFTKLDSGIIDSSIWAEPLATRVVWVTFLAKADRKGFVGASYSGMLRASNVPLDDFRLAVETLEAPDPDSRSKEFDGRRIQKVSGGWLILNYEKYRQFSYSDSKEAIKKRKQREKGGGHEGDIRGHVPFVPGHSASASASASASEDLRKEAELFEKLWKSWPQEGRFKKRICAQKFKALYKRGEFEAFRKATLGYSNYLIHKKENEGFAQSPMHLATWLNNWKEEVSRYVGKDGEPFKYEPRL